jgi:hypothetical protein
MGRDIQGQNEIARCRDAIPQICVWNNMTDEIRNVHKFRMAFLICTEELEKPLKHMTETEFPDKLTA